MGKPEPVAWWCEKEKKPMSLQGILTYCVICAAHLHIPLYPPSVVAGELKSMCVWLEGENELPMRFVNAICDELTRRVKSWETK